MVRRPSESRLGEYIRTARWRSVTYLGSLLASISGVTVLAQELPGKVDREQIPRGAMVAQIEQDPGNPGAEVLGWGGVLMGTATAMGGLIGAYYDRRNKGKQAQYDHEYRMQIAYQRTYELGMWSRSTYGWVQLAQVKLTELSAVGMPPPPGPPPEPIPVPVPKPEGIHDDATA
jgi:hypothetical protein